MPRGCGVATQAHLVSVPSHWGDRRGPGVRTGVVPWFQRSSRQYSQRSPRKKNCLPAIAAEALK